MGGVGLIRNGIKPFAVAGAILALSGTGDLTVNAAHADEVKPGCTIESDDTIKATIPVNDINWGLIAEKTDETVTKSPDGTLKTEGTDSLVAPILDMVESRSYTVIRHPDGSVEANEFDLYILPIPLVIKQPMDKDNANDVVNRAEQAVSKCEKRRKSPEYVS